MNLRDITYLKVEQLGLRDKYIVLDHTSDLSIAQSANISENPIDATLGTSIQENKVVNMITLGVSGSFSSRNSGRILPVRQQSLLFKSGTNRLETIVDWFEKALDNKTLFTVCKKGVLYKDQLLNNIKWTLDDSNSKLGVVLSFIEVVMAERAEIEGSITIIPAGSSSEPISESESIKARDIYNTRTSGDQE